MFRMFFLDIGDSLYVIYHYTCSMCHLPAFLGDICLGQLCAPNTFHLPTSSLIFPREARHISISNRRWMCLLDFPLPAYHLICSVSLSLSRFQRSMSKWCSPCQTHLKAPLTLMSVTYRSTSPGLLQMLKWYKYITYTVILLCSPCHSLVLYLDHTISSYVSDSV